MKRIPIIGLPGWSTGENSFGATKAYLHFLSMFGEVRILTPKKTIDEDLDLVLLPGGKDLSPQRYNQVPGYYNSDADQHKQAFIHYNLPKYIKAGIPIYGTCLGFQELIVYFGGNLQQDISHLGHETSESHKRDELVNSLEFTLPFLKLEKNLLNGRKGPIKVCSLHHQGALESDVTNEFNIIAVNKADGVVEAIIHKTLPIAAMQCHVEEDYNVLGTYLIKSLLKKSPNMLKDESKGNTLVSAE